MTRIFPKLDGTAYDLDDRLVGEAGITTRRGPQLKAEFAQGALPWWLSYVTDNGPTQPTIDGLLDGGNRTSVRLDTGTTTAGDASALQAPPLNWAQWREIRLFAWGIVPDSGGDSNAVAALSIGDDPDPRQATNTAAITADATDGELYVAGGGSTHFSAPQSAVSLGAGDAFDFGLTIRQNAPEGGSGGPARLTWYINGQLWDRWPFDRGFPGTMNLIPQVGLVTDDPSSDRSLWLDGIALHAIPLLESGTYLTEGYSTAGGIPTSFEGDDPLASYRGDVANWSVTTDSADVLDGSQALSGQGAEAIIYDGDGSTVELDKTYRVGVKSPQGSYGQPLFWFLQPDSTGDVPIGYWVMAAGRTNGIRLYRSDPAGASTGGELDRSEFGYGGEYVYVELTHNSSGVIDVRMVDPADDTTIGTPISYDTSNDPVTYSQGPHGHRGHGDGVFVDDLHEVTQ